MGLVANHNWQIDCKVLHLRRYVETHKQQTKSIKHGSHDWPMDVPVDGEEFECVMVYTLPLGKRIDMI